MMTRDEAVELARDLTNEDLLGEYLYARERMQAPGYWDFPDENVEQAARVAREEILRRMENP